MRYSHGGSSPPICTIFKNGAVLKWRRELTRNQLGTKVREGSNPSGSAILWSHTQAVKGSDWKSDRLSKSQCEGSNPSGSAIFYGVVLKLVKRVDC